MQTAVATRMRWADRHQAAIEEVLREHAGLVVSIRTATREEDVSQATDMVVELAGGRVAVRIRDRRYLPYRDLTIRARSAHSGLTEIHKLRAGWGDYYLYAWSDGVDGFAAWMLVNLERMRASGLLDDQLLIANVDRRTGFIAISAEELRDADCLVAHSANLFTAL